jgi:hypothetical protein
LVTPKPVADNPFLQHFSHLVLGAPAGQSVAHDAFRYALLSLSSLDLGIRLDEGSDPVSDNAMYDISHEQRGQAQLLLKACIASDIPKSDYSAADLVFATVVALCQRDVSPSETLVSTDIIAAGRVSRLGGATTNGTRDHQQLWGSWSVYQYASDRRKAIPGRATGDSRSDWYVRSLSLEADFQRLVDIPEQPENIYLGQ